MAGNLVTSDKLGSSSRQHLKEEFEGKDADKDLESGLKPRQLQSPLTVKRLDDQASNPDKSLNLNHEYTDAHLELPNEKDVRLQGSPANRLHTR